ncbi:MAG: hypothetical protein ACKOW8_13505, partial [Flavobacteriales bacterium]
KRIARMFTLILLLYPFSKVTVNPYTNNVNNMHVVIMEVGTGNISRIYTMRLKYFCRDANRSVK